MISLNRRPVSPASQMARRQMLPVRKVNETAAAFQPDKSRVKFRRHVQQGSHGGADGPKVLCRLHLCYAKTLAQFF